jgi:L-fuconolactonase
MRIDAHQHFWRLKRGDYSWLTPELAAIYRDFQPEDLQPLLEAQGVDGTILVQAAPTVAETHYMLAVASETPWVRGVVGWAPLDAEEAVSTIAGLAQDPLLVGLRPMLHDLADDRWILRLDVAVGLAAMEHHGLVLDALVRPQHLPHIRQLLARHPQLPVVIDHAAKPAFRPGGFNGWAEDMTAIAGESQVCCKLSGLLTEAGPGAGADTLRPYWEHLLAVFGPTRLLWGSDWPVLTLAAPYAGWWAVTEQLLAPLNDAERAAILGGNAQRIYLSSRGRH